MANTMRWRYGDTDPIMAFVLSHVAIEIGDLLFQLGEHALPARELADLGSYEMNQASFRDHFLGVAMQMSPVDEARPIRVATSGVFEFACLPDWIECDDWLGVELEGPELLNQRVVKVPTAERAIGRCARLNNGRDTRVLMQVLTPRCVLKK